MDTPVSLSIRHTYEDTPLAGVEFSLYLVSAMDSCGELTPTAAFAAFAGQLDIRGSDDQAWLDMTELLDQAVEADASLAPADTALTDEQGVAAFPSAGKTLEKGLYLVRGQTLTLEGYHYITMPFLALLPGRDSVTDDWIYGVQATSKPAQTPVLEDLTVKKVWKDYGQTDRRTVSVTVQLLCDGAAFGEPVTLSAENDWTHTWPGLESNRQWTVQEAAVEGYTDSVRREGNTFILTNKLDVAVLPQTGQLNWPIPVLVVVGLGLFAAGWILCLRGKKETDAV